MKDLHIMLAADIHRKFMTKATSENTKASALLRKWINKYLKGELR